jgi:hypothetical protein
VNHDQAFGHYLRLQRELMAAYTASNCQDGLIERLTDDLAIARRSVEKEKTDDTQVGDSTLPGLFAD